MRLVSFGNYTLPQNNSRQDLPVAYRSAVIPLRGGGYDQDGYKTYPESKMLSWNFQVYPQDGAIDTIIDAIYEQSAIGRRVLLATMRDGSQRQQWAKLVSASTSPDSSVYFPSSLGNHGYEIMQCQFEMSYPYWEHSSDMHLLLDNGLTLNSGLTLDDGNYQVGIIDTQGETMTINNAGNTKIRKFTLSMLGRDNVNVTGISIKNLTTNESLYWSGNLVTGNFLLINNLEQRVQFNYQNAWADVTLGTNQIGFFTLMQGNNVFEFRFDSDNFWLSGTDVYTRFDWTRHYIR